ncbi:hypothetical protein [Tautonia marina]|uniref:hypothetical protein n=1 Tax=Tautonia marina TaxID=2653855 RepID=UPI0013754D5C|nr:hypothetical protein [Tautonia marina]
MLQHPVEGRPATNEPFAAEGGVFEIEEGIEGIRFQGAGTLAGGILLAEPPAIDGRSGGGFEVLLGRLLTALKANIGNGHAADDGSLGNVLGPDLVVPFGDGGGYGAAVGFGDKNLGGQTMPEGIAARSGLAFGGFRAGGFLSVAAVGFGAAVCGCGVHDDFSRIGRTFGVQDRGRNLDRGLLKGSLRSRGGGWIRV